MTRSTSTQRRRAPLRPHARRGVDGRLREPPARRSPAFVNAPSSRGVVFTRGTTESINLVAYAWARRRLGPGDEILVTVMEHHSNIVPWQLTATDTGATVRFIPVTDGGRARLLRRSTTSSPSGRSSSASPACRTCSARSTTSTRDRRGGARGRRARARGRRAARPALAGRLRKRSAVDFLAFSAHKMLGPTGVGALVARPELLEEMDPFLGGGEMIRDVTLEGATWNDIPYKFEGGTMMVAEADRVRRGDRLPRRPRDGRRPRPRGRAHALRPEGARPTRRACVVYGPAEPERRGATLLLQRLRWPGTS